MTVIPFLLTVKHFWSGPIASIGITLWADRLYTGKKDMRKARTDMPIALAQSSAVAPIL